MKCFKIFVIILTFVITLCSCTPLFPDDMDIGDNVLRRLFSAIETQDEEALTALFSSNAVKQAQDFDGSVDALFDYVQGELVEFEVFGLYSSESDDIDKDYAELTCGYEVKTTKGEYRVAFLYVVENTGDFDDEGIRSLSVIVREEDTDLEVSYVGDGQYSPGIHVAVPNAETHFEGDYDEEYVQPEDWPLTEEQIRLIACDFLVYNLNLSPKAYKIDDILFNESNNTWRIGFIAKDTQSKSIYMEISGTSAEVISYQMGD